MKVFGICGWKNSGKTGLMERLIAEFSARGLRVSTVKHAHHHFDVDQEGKDSYRHRQAGADEVLLSSSRRFALMRENRGKAEASLDELLARLDPCDLALVEGFKRDAHPKIEAHRGATRQDLLAHGDPNILAVASDRDLPDCPVPVIDLDDTIALADFIQTYLSLPGDLKGPATGGSALPEGVDWLPVDDTLARLKAAVSPIADTEMVPLAEASGRFLSDPLVALRSNPPAANSAVDGYALAHETIADPSSVPLDSGRAAPGAAFDGALVPGKALRILTGALLPNGADTVVLQEDVTPGEGTIRLKRLPKPGANTRKAGEDKSKGARLFDAGTKVGAPEIALLAATGHAALPVHRRLRVGILSTGDELVAPGHATSTTQTMDANGPMLAAMVTGWGYEAIPLGRVGDRRDLVKSALDEAARQVDVLIASGGASAGDEDHMSALLAENGDLQNWRVAIKPGRPLALASWNGMQVFALPGNPVAAFVCTLIFARPALSVMAGGPWLLPEPVFAPAAFSKSKKAGRREYLRARLNREGQVEVFASEGSGRISGLAWAKGLVELPDTALTIRPGTLVRYLPFSGFGLT